MGFLGCMIPRWRTKDACFARLAEADIDKRWDDRILNGEGVAGDLGDFSSSSGCESLSSWSDEGRRSVSMGAGMFRLLSGAFIRCVMSKDVVFLLEFSEWYSSRLAVISSCSSKLVNSPLTSLSTPGLPVILVRWVWSPKTETYCFLFSALISHWATWTTVKRGGCPSGECKPSNAKELFAAANLDVKCWKGVPVSFLCVYAGVCVYVSVGLCWISTGESVVGERCAHSSVRPKLTTK